MKKFLLWVWQLPQNLIGLILTIRAEKDETYQNVYFSKAMMRAGICLGCFIILDPIYKSFKTTNPDYFKECVNHEVGHSKQSQMLGWFYLIIVGIPSLIGNIYSRIMKKDSKWYYSRFPENWADKLGGVERHY